MRNTLIAVGSALVFALAAASSAQAGQRVALRDEIMAAGADVRLGDLFDNAGAAAGVIVGRATGPILVLDARQVQAIAAARGLDWANPNGYGQLVVKTALPEPGAAIALSGQAPAAEVAAAHAAAPVAEKMVEALAWAHNLATGDVVRNEDVVWTKMPARLVGRDAARDPETVVGQVARHALREGAPTLMHDLAQPRVVRRDQDVEVMFLQDGVKLVLTGRAMADAAVGEPVQVLNTQSKRVIGAIASGPGQAVVATQSDPQKSNRLASLP